MRELTEFGKNNESVTTQGRDNSFSTKKSSGNEGCQNKGSAVRRQPEDHVFSPTSLQTFSSEEKSLTHTEQQRILYSDHSREPVGKCNNKL